jgi:hypothetical protein
VSTGVNDTHKGAQQIGKIEWRRIGQSDFAIPKRLTLRTSSPDLPYEITITITNDGEPLCSELVLRPKAGGIAVTTDGLRQVPVARLVKWANEMFLGRLKSPARGIAGGVSLLSSLDEAGEATSAAQSEERAGRRRITDDDLRRLAEICRRADATGTSYIAIAELEMGLTADQCRQWKRKAISAGFYERRVT